MLFTRIIISTLLRPVYWLNMDHCTNSNVATLPTRRAVVLKVLSLLPSTLYKNCTFRRHLLHCAQNKITLDKSKSINF